MPGAAEEKTRRRPAHDPPIEDAESVRDHRIGASPSEGKPTRASETEDKSLLLDKDLDASRRGLPSHDEQAAEASDHETKDDSSTTSSTVQLSKPQAHMKRSRQHNVESGLSETHFDARVAADRERRRRNAVRTRQLKKQRIQALREKLNYFSKKESELTQENEVLRAQIKILRSLRTEPPDVAEAPLGSNAPNNASSTTTEYDSKKAAIPRTTADQSQPPQLDAQTAASVTNHPQLPGRTTALPSALPPFSPPTIHMPASFRASVQHVATPPLVGPPSFDALLASFLVLHSGDTRTHPMLSPTAGLVTGGSHGNPNTRILPPLLGAPPVALTAQAQATHVPASGHPFPTNLSADELKNYIIATLLQNMTQQTPTSAPPPT